MKHLSLFSGVGGIDLGFERAGMISAGQVEFNAHSRTVLQAHWPNVSRWKDVREVHDASTHTRDLVPAFRNPRIRGDGDLESGRHTASNRRHAQSEDDSLLGSGATCDNCLPTRIDVLSGGFPCQDISVAGRRKGLDGDSSGLWFEFARLITEIAPPWVLIENVPGLLSSNQGRDLGTIVGFLADSGYEWAFRVLDAQYFGVAQRRRRVFIVASRGAGSAIEVLFESESVSGDSPPRREAGKDVAPTLAARASAGGGLGTDFDLDGGLLPEVAPPMMGRPYKSANVEGGEDVVIPFAQNTRDEVRIIGEEEGAHVAGALAAQPGMKQTTYLAFPSNAGNRLDAEIHTDQSPPVKVGSGSGANPPAIAGFSAGQSSEAGSLGYSEEQSPTLRGAASGTNQVPTLLSSGVRRLMPVECERLQGFPDGWSSDIVSDSQAYRQMGNAVTVPVAEWIGRRIMAAGGESA